MNDDQNKNQNQGFAHGQVDPTEAGKKGGQSQGQDTNLGNFANRPEEDTEEAGRKGGSQ